jgi:hypothetical protein
VTTLREAAQQALEALLAAWQHNPHWQTNDAITALRDALAKPEPRNQCGETCERAKLCAVCARGLEETAQTPCDTAEYGVCDAIDCCLKPVQEEQEPTARFKCTVVDDQHPNGVPFEQWANALARWAHEQEEPPDTDLQWGYEAARRWVRQVGLPSLAQQDVPEANFGNMEPVAWMYVGIKHDGTTHGPHLVWMPQYMDSMSAEKGAKATPLYTHPPRREWQGLTDEEIYPLYSEPSSDAEMVEFARAIEAKLKEKNNG